MPTRSSTQSSPSLPGVELSHRRVTVVGPAGVSVPVDVEETGPSTGVHVIFLHGLVGLNDHWEGVVAGIQDIARCVLVQMPLLDLRDDDCSIHGATQLTIAFLDAHFAGKKCVLVGNSFGGHIAAKIAIDRPDLVAGLVLAGASGVIEKTLMSDVQIRPSRAWLERKIGELFYDKSKMNPADIDRAYEELSGRGHARAMIRLSRTARKNHLGEHLHKVTAPTILIWGRQDIVTPPEACEHFHAKIRGSRVVWFETCGHAPMIECPEPFAAAMREFLATLG
jgi:2-hydroxy-6-oxonona-2,4-dienedioate hydrolase